MIIAGIDPGSRITGYAFLRERRDCPEVLAYGVISPPSALELPGKLLYIFESLSGLISEFCPDELALEEAFFSRFVRPMLVLGHTRGAIMVAAAKQGISIHEYSPRYVKKMVTGRGDASKEQVAACMQQSLRLQDPVQLVDAADALAIAYCRLNNYIRGRR